MFGSNTININLWRSNMNTENHTWGKRFYDKLHSQKIFINQFIGCHSTQQSIDVGYLFFLPIRYYNNNGIEFYTL